MSYFTLSRLDTPLDDKVKHGHGIGHLMPTNWLAMLPLEPCQILLLPWQFSSGKLLYPPPESFVRTGS